jgi:hypothetical protein
MKKLFFIICLPIAIILTISFWTIVNKGYDRQNEIILTIKKIIPPKFARKLRDTIFYIPNLQQRNKFLSLQVEKYEQGLEGKLFKKINISSNENKNFELKEFFLPFPRLDTRLGWAATENSKRAHYLEIVGDKVLLISGLGQTLYFDKKNISLETLSQINIPNNLEYILKKKNFKLIGIRDLFVEDDYVYISLQHKDSKGFTINIYRAKLNFEKLEFSQFFKTNEYWQKYNVFSGGRIESYKQNKILFSIGFAAEKGKSQDKNSLLGKIIAIDKENSKYNLISIGHRNPQGLFYEKNLDLIINTEHGPKGGDEINLNFQEYETHPNYGWDIASYGYPYSGDDKFKKSHKDHGFIEPFRNYTPSIGISEIVNLPKRKNLMSSNNTLYVSSLRAGSIYIIETDEYLKKIIDEDRLFFKEQRIRDLEFDTELNVFFILFEYTPSIGVLKYLN